MAAEPLVAEQLEILSRANKVLFGIASLRPNASLYSDGVFDAAALQRYFDGDAVGVLAARFIDAWGQPVAGTLDDRVIGLSLDDLLRIDLRICVAGGFDKVPAILAALRRGYANVLVTDAATARGILRADGARVRPARRRQAGDQAARRVSRATTSRSSSTSPTRWSRRCSTAPFAPIAPFFGRSRLRSARWWRWRARVRARSAW